MAFSAGTTPPQPSTTDRTSTGDRQSATAETELAGRSDGITATEQRVLNHWRQLLGAAEVVPNDDFFDQGGHSLLATRLAGRLTAEFGLNVPVQQLAGAGVPVERLVMVEPAIPEPGIQEISEAYAVGRLAADVAATLGTWSQPPDVAELAALSHAERLHRLQRWLVDSGALRTEIPIADLASRLAVFQGNHDALRTYRPQPTEVAVSLA